MNVEDAPEPTDGRPGGGSQLWSPFGVAAPEDPFAAIQRLLRANAVPPGIPTIHVPPPVAAAPPVRPIAPVSDAPPEDDFMREEFLFLDRRILRSAREPTDEDLQLEDSDGLPRGPPDEE